MNVAQAGPRGRQVRPATAAADGTDGEEGRTLAAFLGGCPLLAGLGGRDLARLAGQVSRRSLPRRAILSHPRQKAEGLTLVRHGSAKVCAPGRDAREVILSLLGPGDYLGELSLLPGPPGNVRVVCLRRTEVVLVPAPVYAALAASRPQVMQALLRATVRRVRRAEAVLRRLALEDVTGRVEETLRQLAADDGVPHVEGAVIPRLPSQALLAGMAGSTRETVSRVLKDLQARQVIACDGRRVLVRHGAGPWN